MSRFTFGPVPSRRLGFSLGVDIIPAKTCSYDCIYCQVGKTVRTVVERKPYFETAEVADEIEAALRRGRVDYVTFSGSGEPTLNARLGEMIREVKRRTRVPVAVITNASLLWQKEVREELSAADVLLPSFDAATEAAFAAVNRPHVEVSLDRVKQGLEALRQEFHGQIWLEIMLIKDMNDDFQHINLLNKTIMPWLPDRIQLTTVTRPPWHPAARELGSLEIERIASVLGDRCEVVSGFDKRIDVSSGDWIETVAEVLGRRSLSLDDVVRMTGVEEAEARRRLSSLVRKGRLKKSRFRGKDYFLTPENRDNLC